MPPSRLSVNHEKGREMKRGLMAAAVAVALFGCTDTDPNKINNDGITGVKPEGAPTTQPSAAPATAPYPGTKEAAAPAAASETPKTTTVTLTEDEIAAIKKLPDADQAGALAQAVCPVSNEHLGSMDVPVKVEHDGKTAFLCCSHCKEDFDADPAGVLAKLAK
jgi:YHS domain-containing protein